MKTISIDGNHISQIGLGGHYNRMEEGIFEERTAYIKPDIERRRRIVQAAVDAGITYFDTTWKNEVEILGKSLIDIDRDKIWVNGMVLGSFPGSRHYNMTAESYFDRWLDHRTELIPGGRFDSVMINAIEEGFDEGLCDTLVTHLMSRKEKGEFKLLGFSTHDPRLARHLLDRYQEFRIAMVPYNFRNRVFEEAFDGYSGTAAIVAMKPLVWAEYGIPFCSVNRLPAFKELFGFELNPLIQAKALRYILSNDKIATVVCAANSTEEVSGIASAGEGQSTSADIDILRMYNDIQGIDRGLPVFIGGLLWDNLRMNYFACQNISRIINSAIPHIPLNTPDSESEIRNCAKELIEKIRVSEYARYVQGICF